MREAPADNIFGKILRGELPSTEVYSDNHVYCFLDLFPQNPGHTLVIPKHKFERLDECPPELLGQVCSRLGKIAKAAVSAVDADGYNLLCNNGKAAGQLINYLHFHIIPRRTADGVFDRWPSYQYPAGKIEIIAERIRSNL